MNPTALRLLKNYGIALFVAGALIWFPLTGLFLSFLTGGLLISLICNVFLIHVTYGVCTRRIAIGWLVLPTICYGAWLIWVVPQNKAVSAEASKLESENRVTEAVPANLALVFPEGDLEIARRAKAHLAPPVRVFIGSIELSTIKVRKILCMSPKPDDPPFIKTSRCPTEPPSQLPADAIFLRSLERPDPQSKSRTYLHRYKLTQNSAAGDRVIGYFNFGWLSAPVWAPIFQAGCFLVDQPAAWLCGISPKLRKVAVGEIGFASQYDAFNEYSDPTIATLADMLGVKFFAEDRPKPWSPEVPRTSPTPTPSVSDTNDMSRYKD
jgi:hypothetical protein